MAVNGPGEQGDLRMTLAVSQSEAMQGTTRLLYLPDGRTLNVIIPPGTQSGQVIRIDGQGLPTTNSGSRGALLITVTIAPSEQFGLQSPSMTGSDTPTEFRAPPPPPLVQQAYPSYNQAGNYTDYQYPAQTEQAGQGYDSNYSPPFPPTPIPSPSSYTPTPTPGSSAYYAPGQMGKQGRSSTRNGNRRGVTIAAIVGLVVLLAASGLIYYAAIYTPAQQHALHVQQTASVQHTAMAQANMTGTAQASATAYPQTRYQQITSQNPTYSDPLSSNTANAWDVNSHCSFTNGSYHAVEEQTGYFFYCMNSAQSYQNFAFQVKMTFLRGSLGGIIFRANTQNSKYYLLRFDRSGRYDLFLYVDSNVHDVKKLAGDVTDALNLDLNQPNLITLIVQDNTFALYINGQYITTITDPNSTLTSGQIGLTAEDYTEAAEMSYQQAKLWKL